MFLTVVVCHRAPVRVGTLCPFNSAAIRAKLKEDGRLKGEERTFERLVPLHLTEAEKTDAAALPDGTILCFYERGKALALARFNLEWLTNGKDAAP